MRTREEAKKIGIELRHAVVHYFGKFTIYKVVDLSKSKKDDIYLNKIDNRMREEICKLQEDIYYQYTIGINENGILIYLVGYCNGPAPEKVTEEVFKWAHLNNIPIAQHINCV